MNKDKRDEAREAAWKRLEINEWRLKLRSTTQQRKAGELLNAMFDAGAASVDRVAVVREAVNEVNKRLDATEKHRTIRLADYDKAMDAVLAEMEVKDEQV